MYTILRCLSFNYQKGANVNYICTILIVLVMRSDNRILLNIIYYRLVFFSFSLLKSQQTLRGNSVWKFYSKKERFLFFILYLKRVLS